MKKNRSVPDATVIPVLIYPDVRLAVAWLTEVFGFGERVRIGDDHRSQLRVGDGAVIIGDVGGDRRPPRTGEVTHCVLVRVEDARAHYERARAGGASILMEPTDMTFGTPVHGGGRCRPPVDVHRDAFRQCTRGLGWSDGRAIASFDSGPCTSRTWVASPRT